MKNIFCIFIFNAIHKQKSNVNVRFFFSQIPYLSRTVLQRRYMHTSAKAAQSESVSGSPPKSNHFFLDPFRTFSESLINIRMKLFELSGSRLSVSGSPPKSNHFLLDPFRTFSESFIKICKKHFELCCRQKTDRQTDKQTRAIGERILPTRQLSPDPVTDFDETFRKCPKWVKEKVIRFWW